MIHQRKILKAIAYAILLCFTSLTGAQPLYAVPSNTQLPVGTVGPNNDPIVMPGGAQVNVNTDHASNTMTITQNGQTSVLQWKDFSIGADATVNFVGTNEQNFNGLNSFNYVNSGNVSEIYGQLNAIGGNIFIANPSGVQIGNSAQINVGSLYATTKDFTRDNLTTIAGMADGDDIRNYLSTHGTITNPAAELMSLGSITSATNVTFDGGRIVLDTDRLFVPDSENGAGTEHMTAEQMGDMLFIRTNDKDNVVLGYTAYDDNGDPSNIGEFHPDTTKFTNIWENDSKVEDGISRYMWVEDVFQLQAMGKYTNGWFALRNAIDANYTASSEYKGLNESATGQGFTSIGSESNKFTGRFDGLGYNIFGLNINKTDGTNVGLFGYAGEGAYIRNFTINGGTITGNNNVGAAVGAFEAGALISNITNTADVSGKTNVGGVVGSGTGTAGVTELRDLVNIGSVKGEGSDDDESNVGGIIGSMTDVTIAGETYNLGAVTGDKGNVGGIAGKAVSSTIGNELKGDGTETFQIYNQLNVTGGWNVGGIVGELTGDSKITNAANHGDVKAKSYTSSNNNYAYHQSTNNGTAWADKATTVDVANAGGIVGRAEGKDGDTRVEITDVQNDGDVTTEQEGDDDHYIAGNVGGVAGSANNTNITNAENSENHVAGAHNVGGIAGYLTGNSTVDSSQNDGGDITATGARHGNQFVQETVRQWADTTEKVNIGNIGGVVGYLYGRNAQIKNSANRGTVHSAYFDTNMSAPETAKAANVGGVVGKVSMKYNVAGGTGTDNEHTTTELLDKFLDGGTDIATVTNSYNTGDVQGYTGVGGVAGQMVRGSITESYNLGDVRSTRIAQTNTVDPLNMGGVVGDTMAAVDGSGTVIYDVYNAGTIGDSEFNYLGRHVGGVVGRLGGTLEKAYNTGDIYNGYSVTGGGVGWWVSGNIKNVFNTGNVTVVNKDINNGNSLVGGVVGAANADTLRFDNEEGEYVPIEKTLSYAYNLGTIRSFVPSDYQSGDKYKNINVVGGIIGGISEHTERKDANGDVLAYTYNLGTVEIDNVYTTGNLYAATSTGKDKDGNEIYVKDSDGVNAIVGRANNNNTNNLAGVSNAYYIKPEDTELFSPLIGDKAPGTYDPYSYSFGTLLWSERNVVMGGDGKSTNYSQFEFKDIKDKNNDYTSGWRFVDGTLPILNAFTPNTAKNENNWKDSVSGKIESVQYGTAANPLLTIINLNNTGVENGISLNWETLGLSGAGSLAVYGGGDLTLTEFCSDTGRYYNGILFSEGALNINAFHEGETAGADATHGFNLGSGSRLYGENVTFNAGENATTLYGDITSTNGSINIIGGDVSVIGSLKSSTAGQSTRVEGVATDAESADSQLPENEDIKITEEKLNNPGALLPTVEKAYSHLVKADDDTTSSISITASGSAEVLYGNMGEGKIETPGSLSVSGKESVYVDSDLHIGGDLNLNSDGEIVLDLSNMGNIGTTPDEKKHHLHDNFLDHFGKDGTGAINVSGGGADGFMIALDMWDYDKNEFDLEKYDIDENNTLAGDINNLQIAGVNGEARDHTFIWVDSAEQLAGIQKYKDANDKEIEEGKTQEATHILEYNFALKDNIDASSIKNYTGIASNKEADGQTDEKFTGTFDGRGFAIIGLDATKDGDGDTPVNAGIFGTIGERIKVDENNNPILDEDGNEIVIQGTVKDLNVYSSQFTGQDTAGAIAGRNEGGLITGVTTLGNTVKVTGELASTEITQGISIEGVENNSTIKVGAAGGLVGVNSGKITDSHVSDTVIASEENIADPSNVMTVAGGVAGINHSTMSSIGEYQSITSTEGPSVTSTSAVLTEVTDERNTIKRGLGGIVGINEGAIFNVAAFGATNGSYGAIGSTSNEYVGGIAGVNYMGIRTSYNESTVIGAANVGGIVGKNDLQYGSVFGGDISNSVNAGSITALAGMLDVSDENTPEHAGGIAGSNYGWINYGRNTGAVTGTNSVGGIVGLNAEGAGIENLSNAIAAEITGEKYVGGIAGTNAGEITAESNLVNEGKITGNQYVGGIAGENTGTIQNVVTGMTLKSTGTDAKYFGGVTGSNSGKITDATNTGIVNAANASYVGGITGENKYKDKDNKEGGVLENAGNSGEVHGYAQVGGVAGKNSSSNFEGTIENSNAVMAENGGAAGIFYENTADLEGVTLVNSGTVKGYVTDASENGTGGIIGVNKGNISSSTLINAVSGTVTGGNNTGGLIGYNTGSVSGGRNNENTMYVHMVYNNGAVKAAESNYSNVGGLIGYNKGTLYAAYNTGDVTGVYNVGGVVGKNEGNVSSVFKTNLGEEHPGNISGDSNVGGIVGYNSGTLTDAYNMIDVSGKTNTGNAVGSNSGTITNVYATNTSGKLIGENTGKTTNAYTFVAGDTAQGAKVVSGGGQSQSGSFGGFNFGSDWKNYDGYTSPMLKVFLTKAYITPDGKVVAADGLDAYNHNSSLIGYNFAGGNGLLFMELFSNQIAPGYRDGVYYPNWLGYDFENTVSVVPTGNNGYIHSEYNRHGGDDEENFRERKAEIHFHNGGMEYDEDM